MSLSLRSPAALCLSLFAFAGAVPGALGAGPQSAVKVLSCSSGEPVEKRSVVFSATMKKRKDSVRMALRFQLYRHPRTTADQAPGAEAAPAAAIGLASWGVWTRSRPGRAVLTATKRVDNLSGPAGYSVKVEMRWIDSNGRTVARKTHTSAVCEQPDYRPDLAAALVSGFDGAAVTVEVRNGGAVTAEPAGLALLAAGVQVGRADVPRLKPGAAARLRVPVGVCAPGTVLLVAVKAGGGQTEARYSNNELALPAC